MTDSRQLALDYIKHAIGVYGLSMTGETKRVVEALEADIAAKVELVTQDRAEELAHRRCKRYIMIDDAPYQFDALTLMDFVADISHHHQQSVPSGFVLVPIEPTWEMLEAAELSLPRGYVDLYKVLIEAAPMTAP